MQLDPGQTQEERRTCTMRSWKSTSRPAQGAQLADSQPGVPGGEDQRGFRLPGQDLRIALSRFEAALSAVGIHPTAAYEQLGEPLRDLPAERAAAACEAQRFPRVAAPRLAASAAPDARKRMSIALLHTAAAALGDLLDEVVFVGGATVGLWITDPAAPQPRPTKDVDVIVEITTRSQYHEFEQRLREPRFREDHEGGGSGR